jgi:S1-C subfamily serine protease
MATRPPRSRLPILSLILAGLVGGGTVHLLGRAVPEPGPAAAGTVPATGTPIPVGAVPLSRLTLSPLVARVAPGVVNIATVQASPLEQNPLLREPFFRFYYGIPDQALAPRLSAGSGFVIDAGRGLVLTNFHVIENARAIAVKFGERTVEAQLIGADPNVDIALLAIPPQEVTALRLGNSERVAVGDYVVAIGNPFEVGQTVTAGIISALGRPRGRGGPSYLQTDAPINPGNSGGPLINMAGEVVGINTAIVGPGEGNVGIGLAVPANVARQVAERILARAGLPGLS